MAMNLNDAQRQAVVDWIAEGLKLSEIQKRLENQFGLRMTYMEARFLLDELKVMPKDPAPPPPPAPSPLTNQGGLAAGPAAGQPPVAEPSSDVSGALPPGSGAVKLTVDHLARPGAMISGSVTFSDGQSGTWFIDEMGQLGLGMKQKGYRPAPADVEEFQMKLQQLLAKQGY
jgi:hypothetical protein